LWQGNPYTRSSANGLRPPQTGKLAQEISNRLTADTGGIPEIDRV